MIKNKFAAILAVAVFVTTSATLAVNAQVMASMPTLYNASGMPVNTMAGTYLPAGYYYLLPGASSQQQVYYYGNGTFAYQDQSMGSFGGSVTDPNGTAGVSFGYAATPGVPNTGAGGNSFATWSVVAVSGLIAVAGLSYLARERKNLVLKKQ